jgi:hypothetical protein
MVDVDKIISLARLKPIQPSDVAKALQIDSIVAGAVLSDLASKKILKVSFLKVGSSPLYFLKENSSRLLDFISFLNEKDRKTVELLKGAKVLRASVQDPLIRVSLANIKDFAVPLEVFHNNKEKEIFYKWFLLDDDKTKEIIENILSGSSEKKFSSESVLSSVSKVGKKKFENSKNEKDKEPEEKKVEEKKSENVNKKVFDDSGKNIEKKNVFVDKTGSSVDVFFEKNNIKILSVLDKKKNFKEFIVSLPTVLGDANFYCAVLEKNKISESDINNVVVKAQLRKLPAVLLYSGSLNQKAVDLSKKVGDIIVKRFL